ncbi:MAG: phosphoribosylglycinamide formyltransferase [Bdellovibrionales bacterium]|nr:phosphoribosylglycinamide formyltransferase [Bdellovibrionales bacterium]
MVTRKARLGFFASHGGSNFQSVVEACHTGMIDAEAGLVVCNNKNAMVLERAEKLRVPSLCVNRKIAGSEEQLDLLILQELAQYEVDLVVLAGYMKKITPKVLEAYDGRILNIHPALLPKFGGKGMYGMHVHEAVVASGAKESGASIHVVTTNYDEGPILAQEAVDLEAEESAESLAKKVLVIEHQLYPRTIQAVLKGQLHLPEPGETTLRKRLAA